MKPWQVLFRMAPKRDHEAQGGSTGDDDFANEAEDDALAEAGEEELESEGDEVDGAESEDDEEDQSDEDQDPDEDDEEAEHEEEQEEDEEPSGFKFKDPKSGDFDFKRINKAVGGDELEKAFKEQNATITRNFQELKSYKDVGSPQEVATFRNKGRFLDDLIDNNPVVQREVLRILNGGQPPQGQNLLPPEAQVPEGVDPNDPWWKGVQPLFQTVQAINNRLVMDDRNRQRAEQDQRFSQGLEGAKARFKELTGKSMSVEQAAMIEQEMRSTNFLNGARLVPDLFSKEIQAAMSRKVISKRVAKKNLPKTGSGRRPAPGPAKKKSRHEERDELWEKHMGDGFDD